MTTQEMIADIFKKNITFSGQLGDYVIHGAIDKIMELLAEKDKEIEGLKDELEISNKQWQDMRDVAESNKLRFVEKTDQLAASGKEIEDNRKVIANAHYELGKRRQTCDQYEKALAAKDLELQNLKAVNEKLKKESEDRHGSNAWLGGDL